MRHFPLTLRPVLAIAALVAVVFMAHPITSAHADLAPWPPDPTPPAPSSIPLTTVALATAPDYPVWLEANGKRTDQTSGLTFVSRDSDGTMHFFSCDDIGALHRIDLNESKRPAHQTTGDGWMTITELTLTPKQLEAFGTFDAKADLEESALNGDVDPPRTSFLISVEGDRLDSEEKSAPRAQEGRIGIATVTLDAPLEHATHVTSVTTDKVMFTDSWAGDWQQPWEGWLSADPNAIRLPIAGMEPNRSFEGMAIGEDSAGNVDWWVAPELPYATDPLIPAPWQGTLPLFTYRSSPTSFGLRTQFLPPDARLESVTGMVLSPDCRTLYLVDRNSARLLRCALDPDGAITAVAVANLSLTGPDGIPYFLPSLESIALDDQGILWCAVDPWKYQPLPNKGQVLSDADKQRYADLVPMLYKFQKWE